MGGMIRGDGIDGAVRQTLPHRLPVLFSPQGGAHLGVGTVEKNRFFGETKVVGRCFGGNLHPPGLSLPDHIHPPGGGYVLNMQPRPRRLGQKNIPLNHQFLRQGGHPLQPQTSRCRAGVDGPVEGQGRFFTVTAHGETVDSGLPEGFKHHPRTGHPFTVIGDAHRPGGFKLPQGANLSAPLPEWDGPHDVDAASQGGAPGKQSRQKLRPGQHRIGIGQTDHTGKAPRRRGGGAGPKGLFMGKPGIAKMNMNVDQPRHRMKPRNIQNRHRIAGGQDNILPHLGNEPPADQNIRPAVSVFTRIHHGGPPEQIIHQPSSPPVLYQHKKTRGFCKD